MLLGNQGKMMKEFDDGKVSVEERWGADERENRSTR